jgi:hypothetical protein
MSALAALVLVQAEGPLAGLPSEPDGRDALRPRAARRLSLRSGGARVREARRPPQGRPRIPRPGGAPLGGSNGCPTRNALPAGEPERIGIHVGDPGANARQDGRREVDPKLARDRRPKDGFCHSAGDGQDDGTIRVRRYAKR